MGPVGVLFVGLFVFEIDSAARPPTPYFDKTLVNESPSDMTITLIAPIQKLKECLVSTVPPCLASSFKN